MPIDTTRLNTITDGDTIVQQELLGLFFNTTDRVMAVLKDVSMDDHAWREAVHEIKGAANTLGFERIGMLCRQVEMLPSLAPVGKEAMVLELESAIGEVRALAATLVK